MREAWKRETYVRFQSFSSELAVKYLHVGRRKIQISPSVLYGSPPPGEVLRRSGAMTAKEHTK